MEASSAQQPVAPELDPRRWLTLGVLCLSLFMIVMGNTVLNVAIPTLVRTLHASNSQLQWIVDAYSLVFAGLLFTGGALGDRFGRKGLLQLGLAIFGLGSAMAAFSTDPAQVIACRAVMGAGAALVMPATLSILANVFPPHERGRAIGIWAGVAGSAGAIGPILCGVLLAHFWWGSVFFLNLPVVLAALLLGRVFVPTSRDPEEARLDLVGAGLSIVAITSLVYAIIQAPDRGWTDPVIVAAFVAAAVFGALFGWWERRVEHPLLDLDYFRNRSFSGGSLAIGLVFFGMFGMFFLSTQYLQLVRGYSALGAGVRLLPFATTLMIVAPSSARLAERIGVRRTVTLGLFLAGCGQFAMASNGVDSPYPLLAASFVILAAGMALTMAPSTASIMSALPLGKAGVGSAMNDTTRELGGSLGVAVLGSLAASRYHSLLASSLGGLPAELVDKARASLGGALDVAGRVDGGHVLAAAARHSYTSAASTAFVIGGIVAWIASFAVSRVLPDTVPAARVTVVDAGPDPAPAPASA
jgi:EmrB/QacA subfamily drug resistance transporter